MKKTPLIGILICIICILTWRIFTFPNTPEVGKRIPLEKGQPIGYDPVTDSFSTSSGLTSRTENEEATSTPEGEAIIMRVGKIDKHLTINDTLEAVSFCGTEYQTKQIHINGVDVVKNIAELAVPIKNNENNLTAIFCENFVACYPYCSAKQNNTSEAPQNIIEVVVYDRRGNNHSAAQTPEYFMNISQLLFSVNSETGTITLYSGGSPAVVGKLR